MSNEKKFTNKFYDYMKKNKVNKSQKRTHTSMGFPYGSYNMKNDKRFFELYNKALQENTNLHIVEVHKEYGPIIIDIDIEQKEDSRIYNLESIKLVLKTYLKIINKYIDTSELDYNIYVTEKETPTKKNTNFKDGFHCIFPDLCILPELQYLIRYEVVKEFKENNYFKNFKILNDYDDIFDKAVIEQTGWLLYGSKKPDKSPYLLTYIFDENLNEIDKKFIYDLPRKLSIRNNDEEDILNPKISDSDIKELLKKYNIQKKQKKKGIRRHNILSQEILDKLRGRINIINGKEIKEFGLLDILNPKRADNYQDWIQLGWTLHNIDNIELLEDWIDFSSKSKKFDNTGNECERLWDGFKNENKGIGSIIYWAKIDNPDKYNEWLKKQEDKYIGKGISGNSADVAEVIFQIKRNNYKCASIKNSTWYEFKNNIWKEIDSGVTIMNYMNDELSDKFQDKCNFFNTELLNKLANNTIKQDDEEYNKLKEKIASSNKVSNLLLDINFKEKIMKELKNKFYDEKFFKLLDENKNLIGFKNGVYDLKNLNFRPGLPEDYISLSTNIEYIEYNENNKLFKQVEKFFSDIQPEEEMKNYVLNFFADCLQGHLQSEQFNIWTGCGANGKSLAIQLFQESMGDYSTNISITLLTNKRASSNAASPELAKCKGIRFVVFQEPENDDKIHVGHMKELTGGDKISARRLYKEPVDFYPQFKTLLTCNKLPFIPSNDGGTWRRLKVVPFEIEFVENPKLEHQRKRDNRLKEELINWKEAFMSILINRLKLITYNKNKNICIHEPKKVKEFTIEYQKTSDRYLEFIKDNLINTNNEDDKIFDNSLYKLFKTWYKEAHTDKQIPSRNEFRSNMEEKIGSIKNLGGGRGWKGYSLLDSYNDNNIDL